MRRARHVGECGEAKRTCGFTTAAAHVPLDGSVAGGEEMADTAMTAQTRRVATDVVFTCLRHGQRAVACQKERKP